PVRISMFRSPEISPPKSSRNVRRDLPFRNNRRFQPAPEPFPDLAASPTLRASYVASTSGSPSSVFRARISARDLREQRVISGRRQRRPDKVRANPPAVPFSARTHGGSSFSY